MKKWTALLLTLVMVLTLSAAAVPVYAAAPSSLTMQADRTEAEAGDVITYTVTMGPVENLRTTKFQLSIPADLTYIQGSGKLADGLSETLDAFAVSFTEETLTFIAGCEQGFTSREDLVLMTFQCKADEGASGRQTVRFKPEASEMFDDQYQPISFTLHNAEVRVGADQDVPRVPVDFSIRTNAAKAAHGSVVTCTVVMGPVQGLADLTVDFRLPEGLTYINESGRVASGLESTLQAERVEFTEPRGRLRAWGCNYSSRSSTELLTFQCRVDNDASGTLKLDLLVEDPGSIIDSKGSDMPYTLSGTTLKIGAEEIGGGGSSGGDVVAEECTLTFVTNGGSSIAAVREVKNATVRLDRFVPVRAGYTFAGWYSDRQLTRPVSRVKLTGDMTVYAGWTAAQEGPAFSDVAPDAYYRDAVQWAVKNGITLGATATTFAPDRTCTRAQAVTFLWRAAGSPAPRSSHIPFRDMSADAYYAQAVLWAMENGVTNGTTATTFSPNAECTRAQIVTFLWRSRQAPVMDTVNPFTDVDDNAYYAQAVVWAVKSGITLGRTATTFAPDADCTRAQIVTFLYRSVGK